MHIGVFGLHIPGLVA